MPTFYWVTRAPRLLQVSSENLRHRFRGAAPLLGPLAPTLTAVLLRVKAESLQQTMTLTVSVASTIAVRVRISNSILNSSQFMSVSDAQVLSWSILNSSNNSWLIWPRNIEGKSFFIVITPSVYNPICPAVRGNRWNTTTFCVQTLCNLRMHHWPCMYPYTGQWGSYIMYESSKLLALGDSCSTARPPFVSADG